MINPNDYTPSHGEEKWKPGDIIGSEHLNTIENQLDILSDLMIDERRIGSTLTMVEESSSMPTKLEVKTMSSEAGGITPAPPTVNQDKSILFADGYNQINVTSSIDNTNNKQDFVINRSSDTSNLASFSIGAASTSNIGLMSSTDKQNLESLWSGSIPKNNNNEMTTIVTQDNFLNQLQNIQTFDSNNNGLVPKTNGASASNYLKANGTWSTINCDEVSGAVKEKTNASLNSIELSPNSSTVNHGGYIDFHYNNSNTDYTSRIIESSSGVLTINGGTTINTSGNVTANSFSGNGASLTNLNGYNITDGVISAARIGSLDASKIGGGTFDISRIPSSGLLGRNIAEYYTLKELSSNDSQAPSSNSGNFQVYGTYSGLANKYLSAILLTFFYKAGGETGYYNEKILLPYSYYQGAIWYGSGTYMSMYVRSTTTNYWRNHGPFYFYPSNGYWEIRLLEGYEGSTLKNSSCILTKVTGVIFR